MMSGGREADPAPVPARVPTEAGMPHGEPPRTILVADDDPTIRELAGRILARELPDHRVELAEDGREAFLRLGEFRPALVILDVQMPRMNGLEVCRKIRSHDSLGEVPILVVTAFSREVPRERLLDAGATLVLEKPFDIAEFAGAVRRLVEIGPDPTPR